MVDVASDDDLADKALTGAKSANVSGRCLRHYRRSNTRSSVSLISEGSPTTRSPGARPPIGTVKLRMRLAYEKIRDAVEKEK